MEPCTAAMTAQLPAVQVFNLLRNIRLLHPACAPLFCRSVTGLVGSGQLEAAFKKGAKDLPNWWTPQLDVGLVLGVVTHGYGEWGPIFEVCGSCMLCADPLMVPGYRLLKC